jgi:hypothetical protein
MTLPIIFTSLIWCCVFNCFSMDIVPYSWHSLFVDMKSKIVACIDSQCRKSLFCVNRELSQFTLRAIVHHSPVYLTRREHIWCLIQCAHDEQKKVMKNLINNAALCDHADVLDWLPIFRNFSTIASEYFLDQKMSHNSRRWIFKRYEESVRLVDLIKKRRATYRDNIKQNWQLICGFFRGDQDVMNEYMCKACHISNKVEIAVGKLNPLLVATLTNNIAMVELITIRNPELINITDANGCTPLYLTEDVDIAQLLLSCKGIDINKGEVINGTTPLQKFAFSGDIDLVQLLLKHPNCKIDKTKSTPLHIAASQGYNDIVEMLLEHDETLLDVQDDQGYTALMYAIESECPAIIQLLLRYEPDYMLKNNDGNAARNLVPNEQIKQILFMHEMNNWPLW